VRAVTEECVALGVEYLTVYAFSTENWKRPPEEVSALWTLLEEFVAQELPTMMENNVKLRTIGRTHELPRAVSARSRRRSPKPPATPRSRSSSRSTTAGGAELVDAARSLCAEAAAGTLDPASVEAGTISAHLYTHDFPDPDLLIRTSGEMRLFKLSPLAAQLH
jgi:undecaprenyl diphosphate synthase